MNILLVGFNIDGAMGDNFNFLVNNLTKNMKYDWFVLTSNKNSNLKFNEGKVLKVSYSIKSPIRILNECNRINKFVKKNKIDRIIILTPNLLYNIFLSIKFVKMRNIYYLHDPKPHSGEGKIRTIILKLQNYLCCSLASKVIVASEFLKKEIIDNNILNINEDKLHVIYLGMLDNLKFENVEINERKSDVLFFGRIEEYKGIEVLCEAIKKINKDNLLIKCKIIGKGDIYKYIKEEDISSFEINNNYVDDYKLAEEIAGTKVVVFPYKNATGTQTIQVAYYYKKPVIVSNVGCFNDYVLNAETGYIFENGNVDELANLIKKIIKNKSMRNDMGINGRRFLQNKFKTEEIIKKYYEVLEMGE